MSTAGVVTLAVFGWLAGALIWIVATALVARRPLSSGPACEQCGATLPAPAWAPAYGFGVSFVCPACEHRQPLGRVPFELAIAAYFAAVALLIDDPVRQVAALVFAVLLALVALIDLRSRLVFSNLLVMGTLLGLAFAALEGLAQIGDALLGAATALVGVAIYFAAVRWAFGRVRVTPIWTGDILLAGMIGAMTRWPVVLTALFLGFALGGLAVVAAVVVKRRLVRSVFYGPFLCLGALIAILWRF
ncbi:MAG: prepilin peptidase [Thermomicrobiales bacterium]